MSSGDSIAVVGTYADVGQQGLFTYHADGTTGALSRVDAADGGACPSYVDVDADGAHVYAVNETTDGTVSAFALEEGEFSPVDRAPSGGDGPCHCRLDETGKWLLVAHYAGGSITVLPVDTDGTLDSPVTRRVHRGSSVDPNRQAQAHPHAAVPGPDNRYVYVPDLGLDQIVVYCFDDEDGSLTRTAAHEIAPGAGPRHLTFGPTGRFAFLLTELGGTVVAYEREVATGRLSIIRTVSTLPAAFDGHNQAAAIRHHPDRRYIYVSNRGHDSIACFKYAKDGRLKLVNHCSTRGHWPRDLAVHPNGTHFYAANERSDTVVRFDIDPSSGRSTATGGWTRVPAPACIEWVPC